MLATFQGRADLFGILFGLVGLEVGGFEAVHLGQVVSNFCTVLALVLIELADHGVIDMLQDLLVGF